MQLLDGGANVWLLFMITHSQVAENVIFRYICFTSWVTSSTTALLCYTVQYCVLKTAAWVLTRSRARTWLDSIQALEITLKVLIGSCVRTLQRYILCCAPRVRCRCRRDFVVDRLEVPR